jgi:hypothetical protein
MEKRKSSTTRPSALPIDYLKMVNEVFSSNFDAGLKIYGEILPHPQFEVQGEIFSDEIVLAVSLTNEGQLAATTVYASVDFDPKASAPTVQDLLGACVDAIATVFSGILSPEHPEIIAEVAEGTLSALENVPFHWTKVEANQRELYVKIDRANLSLDSLTDEWLRKNDPNAKERLKEEQEETEKLFITGKPKPSSSGGHGSPFSH